MVIIIILFLLFIPPVGIFPSDVNKTKFLRPRPRPPEVNKIKALGGFNV